MKRHFLSWLVDSSGVRFFVQKEASSITSGSWLQSDLKNAMGLSARIAPLLEHIQAVSNENLPDEIHVPWSIVACWSANQLTGLGLPEPYPYGLKVTRRGTVDEDDFRLEYSFVRPNGQPLAGVKRTGAILEIGSRQNTLTDPLYEIVAAIDEWKNETGSADEPMAARLGRLEKAVGLMGQSIRNLRADEYLESIQITSAPALTLRPFRNQSGQPDFDPVPARPRRNLPEESEGHEEFLPKAKLQSFAEQFRGFRKERGQYALGGWIVVFPPQVQAVLGAMKHFQLADPETRLGFIRNPQTMLKEALAGQPAVDLVDELFWESEEYSARVREIGVRQPRVIPFLGKPSQPWLPPETGSLRIDDELLHLTRELAVELESIAQNAKAQGAQHVEYQGHRVPLTEESLAAISSLVRGLGASRRGDGNTPSPANVGIPPDRITLIVEDNIDDVSFRAGTVSRQLEVGGVPDLLSGRLFPHQRHGLRWLQQSYSEGQRGVLLADDMGLGKTLQVLAFLAWKRQVEPKDHRPILVVAPTGLIRTWIQENETHLESNGLGAPVAVTGNELKRLREADSAKGKETVGGLPALKIDCLQGADWVLTTYETLRDYQHSFGRVGWSVIVLDEVQKIKNPASITCDAVKAMKAEFSIAMTGTPVENHVADLWSIVDAVYPARLGALREFIERVGDDSTQQEALHHELVNTVPPCLILRRMKEDHLKDLPSITRHIEDCRVPMPREQALAYSQTVEKASRMSGQGFMMTILHELRSISVHPSPDSPVDDHDVIQSSAKLEFLFRILDTVRSRSEKALIFIESITMQGVLAGLIQRRYSLEHTPMILNGSVAGSRRKEMVDVFQESKEPFDVMILSPKAGGVGITLTAANHVIHLMRWWNPAVEDQATDRVYRIGQKKDVHVYLPSAIHPEYGEYSFDLKLNQLLESKRALSRNILTPSHSTEEDMDQLFKDTILRSRPS